MWGPWANHKIDLDITWLQQELIKKTGLINFQTVADDVHQFIKPPEQHSLSLWSENFFVHKIEKLCK